MANYNKKVLGRSIVVMVFTAVSANASELWQYSNPLFESFDLTAGNGNVTGSTQSWAAQSFGLAETTTQGATSSTANWYSSANWSVGPDSSSTSSSTVLADDVFRGYLFNETSPTYSTSSSASSGGSWFSGFFADSVSSTASTTSNQNSGSFWNSNNGWDTSGSGSTASNTLWQGWQGGWSGGSFGSASSNSSSSGGGEWWSSYRGFGGSGSAASSDSAACTMVSSWAGTGGWRSFFDGEAPAETVAPAGGCNAQQASTIANLAPTTNLVAKNGPIVTGDPVDESTVLGASDNPEPGTWLMMVGGCGFLGFLRRRANAKTTV